VNRCGWGSFSLFIAAKHPNSQITGFSNSATQKKHIDSVAAAQGLTNLTVITGDVVDYEFEAEAFDRVVSIELFEHMKNYEALMGKVSRALKPGGKLFVHIFCHKDTPYDFEGGWMSEYFFTGGSYHSLPSPSPPRSFQTYLFNTHTTQEQCPPLTSSTSSNPPSPCSSNGGSTATTTRKPAKTGSPRCSRTRRRSGRILWRRTARRML
jgi:SAM-dependent methyltransferase